MGLGESTLGTIPTAEEVRRREKQRRDSNLKRMVERFKKMGDEENLKSLSEYDSRVVKCELCDKWFFKESTGYEDICPDCQENDDVIGDPNQTFLCSWCGIKFHRTKDWLSARYCSEDCQQKDFGLREREQNRKARANNGII